MLPKILVTLNQPVRIGFEVLGRKLEQLGVFERFHLMYEPWQDVHTVAGRYLELIEFIAISRFLDTQLETSFVQIKGFGLQLMIMQGTSLALLDFQNFAAIERIVDNPNLSAPSLRFDMYRLSRINAHRVFLF
jgi:hypothetical protein